MSFLSLISFLPCVLFSFFHSLHNCFSPLFCLSLLFFFFLFSFVSFSLLCLSILLSLSLISPPPHLLCFVFFFASFPLLFLPFLVLVLLLFFHCLSFLPSWSHIFPPFPFLLPFFHHFVVSLCSSVQQFFFFMFPFFFVFLCSFPSILAVSNGPGSKHEAYYKLW